MRWTVNALVAAEELGVTAANADSQAQGRGRAGAPPAGHGARHRQSFGLDEQWARNAIKAVGNYGEVWNRNLGAARAEA